MCADRFLPFLLIEQCDQKESAAMHEYLRRILIAQGLGLIDSAAAAHVAVAHDSWCKAQVGNGECNCDPEISMETDRGRVFIDRDGSLIFPEKN